MIPVRAQPEFTRDRREQAVVLGGRVAGTLAACVLADHYERVVVIDRDEPAPSSYRRGRAYAPAQILPYDRASRLERVWPGLVAELIADGAAAVGRRSPGSGTLQATRFFFEHHLWRRLTAFDTITRLSGFDAVGLLATEQSCGGVWVMSRTRGAAARTIHADLVVDAMGVGSRLTRWLADTWHASVPTERPEAAFRYLSRRYRLPSSTPAGVRRGRSPDGQHDWMIMAVEDGDHVVTIGGSDPGLESVELGHFDALVGTAVAPELAIEIGHGSPVSGLCSFSRFPFQRRRFDRALGLPGGLLALGGSLGSTDPLDGMALSDAVTEADLLGQALHGIDGPDAADHSGLAKHYFAAALGDHARSAG